MEAGGNQYVWIRMKLDTEAIDMEAGGNRYMWIRMKRLDRWLNRRLDRKLDMEAIDKEAIDTEA